MEAVLHASQAVCISEYYADMNMNQKRPLTLFVGRFSGPGDVYCSIINLDFSDFLTMIPPNAVIRQAYLHLNVTRNDLKSGAVTVGLYRCLEHWNPVSVSWRNQPGTERTPQKIFSIPGRWKGITLVEMTDLVQSWLKSDVPHYGYMIRGEEMNDRLIGFVPEVSIRVIFSATS
ncbi:MAG: DNRLRE domain-containing protein [Syntrophomonadaceae bacterium]|nr:DNRLRE domain-containing protein [Syntrophomonadaceae bacterium]